MRQNVINNPMISGITPTRQLSNQNSSNIRCSHGNNGDSPSLTFVAHNNSKNNHKDQSFLTFRVCLQCVCACVWRLAVLSSSSWSVTVWTPLNAVRSILVLYLINVSQLSSWRSNPHTHTAIGAWVVTRSVTSTCKQTWKMCSAGAPSTKIENHCYKGSQFQSWRRPALHI